MGQAMGGPINQMWWKRDGGPIEWIRLIAVHDRVRRKVLCRKKEAGIVSSEFSAGIEGKSFGQ